MSATSDYFARMTPQERQRLDEAARRCPLGLSMMPMDRLILEEVLAWQALEIEVLGAYTDWLSATKAAVEALGRPWTVEALNRYLDEEPS